MTIVTQTDIQKYRMTAVTELPFGLSITYYYGMLGGSLTYSRSQQHYVEVTVQLHHLVACLADTGSQLTTGLEFRGTW
jgi:hypothetical protein